MAERHSKQQVVVYRAISTNRQNSFAYPIYSVQLEYRPGQKSFLRIGVEADIASGDQVLLFIESMRAPLSKRGLRIVPSVTPCTDRAETLELFEFCLEYIGESNFRRKKVASRFMRQLANLLGTPSMGRITVMEAHRDRSSSCLLPVESELMAVRV